MVLALVCSDKNDYYFVHCSLFQIFSNIAGTEVVFVVRYKGTCLPKWALYKQLVSITGLSTVGTILMKNTTDPFPEMMCLKKAQKHPK
jgi:hypothetical protein